MLKDGAQHLNNSDLVKFLICKIFSNSYSLYCASITDTFGSNIMCVRIFYIQIEYKFMCILTNQIDSQQLAKEVKERQKVCDCDMIQCTNFSL